MLAEPAFPRAFGKYTLIRPFARGGMGEIYLAAVGELGGAEKLCVLKKVPEDRDVPGLNARLLDEAKVAVRLNHTNLVQVFDAGEVDHDLYIAMELIEGRDLRALWNRCAEAQVRIPTDLALYMVRELARGLEYAHTYGGLGLVHRDIAPPNILISWHGEVKLTDFGLARSILKNEKTAPGIVFGRIAYLAPEQARGEQADARTDIYALSVILWELLTGRGLHETTEDQVRNLDMARNPTTQPPSKIVRGLDSRIDKVVMKGLAHTREARYQTAGEFRAAIAEVLARVAPGTDSSQLGTFLSKLFDKEIVDETAERQRLLGHEISEIRREIERSPKPSGMRPAMSEQAQRMNATRPLKAVRDDEPTRPVDDDNDDDRHGDPVTLVHFSPTLPPEIPDDDEPTNAAGKNPLAIAAAEAKLDAQGLVGEVFDGRYRLERLLGSGGMGAVYEAVHLQIGKRVAVKVLHPVYSRQPDLVGRFQREARAATLVGHPNIVDVTDSGTTTRGDVYFVMERLEGSDLGDVLHHERRLAPDRAINIAVQICRALAAAHSAGIIHRDLKPENVFLTSRDGTADFVKVLDFGIATQDATRPSGRRRITSPGMAIGTPEYMAPEQAVGQPSDARSDIYALGAILYEMLTGDTPHSGNDVMELLRKKATEPPRPLRELAPDVPPALEDIVMACLAQDPDGRPPTMTAVEYELTKGAKGRGSAVAAVLGISPQLPAEIPERTRSKTAHIHAPSRKVRNLALAVGGGVLFAMGVYLPFRGAPKPTPPHTPSSPTPVAVSPSPGPVASPTPSPRAGMQPGLTPQEIARLLEWAKRAADGGRYVAPPGDNLKELLDRIETVEAGNPGALAIRKQTLAALAKKSTLALKRNQLEDAETFLKAIVVLNPGDDSARLKLARVLAGRAEQAVERKRFAQANTFITRAVELAPTSTPIRMVLADIYLAQGKHEAAAAEYQRILDDKPSDKRAIKGLETATQPPPKALPKKKRRK